MKLLTQALVDAAIEALDLADGDSDVEFNGDESYNREGGP